MVMVLIVCLVFTGGSNAGKDAVKEYIMIRCNIIQWLCFWLRFKSNVTLLNMSAVGDAAVFSEYK